jgi:hypothetical protein
MLQFWIVGFLSSVSLVIAFFGTDKTIESFTDSPSLEKGKSMAKIPLCMEQISYI